MKRASMSNSSPDALVAHARARHRPVVPVQVDDAVIGEHARTVGGGAARQRRSGLPRVDRGVRHRERPPDRGVQPRLAAQRLGHLELLDRERRGVAALEEAVGVRRVVVGRLHEQPAGVLDAVRHQPAQERVLVDALLGRDRILDDVAPAGVQQPVEAPARALDQVGALDQHRRRSRAGPHPRPSRDPWRRRRSPEPPSGSACSRPPSTQPYSSRGCIMIAPGARGIHRFGGPGNRLFAVPDLRLGGARRLRRPEGAPPHLPAPRLGRARPRGDLAQRRLRRAGGAVEGAVAGGRPDGARHHQPARDDRRVGPGDRPPGAQRHHLAGHAHRQADPRVRRRRGPGSLQAALRPAAGHVLLRPEAGLAARSRGRPARAGRGRRSGVRNDGLVADLEADGRALHRRHEREPHDAHEPGDARLGPGAAGRVRGPARDAARDPLVVGDLRRGADARRRAGGVGARRPAARRCSGRPASSAATRSAPTARAASC